MEDVLPDTSLMVGGGACDCSAAAYGSLAAGPVREKDWHNRAAWPASTAWIASAWASPRGHGDCRGDPRRRRRSSSIESVLAWLGRLRGGRWAVLRSSRLESIA